MEALDLTPEERRAITTLKRLAKRWPRTLWLYSASGSLCVVRYAENGERAHKKGGGVDPSYVADTIDIPNDGGDW